MTSITARSVEPLGRLLSWLPRELDADQVVFLPDACPGKSPLPTGTATLTRQPDWRRFALSDCGCGMLLVESRLRPDDLTSALWDRLADRLRRRKGMLGDLGGGNHFLDALASYSHDRLSFLVHTGSRSESGLVDDLVGSPAAFDLEFARISAWAAANRAQVAEEIAAVCGPLSLVLDQPHNSVEPLPGGGAIIRKGAVHLRPGDLTVLPAHMDDDVALLRATDRIADTLFSFGHGTGRAMARSDSKDAAVGYDFAGLRQRVLMPTGLDDSSLRTEGPFAYRDLDPCLALVEDLATVEDRYQVVAYMGHLG